MTKEIQEIKKIACSCCRGYGEICHWMRSETSNHAKHSEFESSPFDSNLSRLFRQRQLKHGIFHSRKTKYLRRKSLWLKEKYWK